MSPRVRFPGGPRSATFIGALVVETNSPFAAAQVAHQVDLGGERIGSRGVVPIDGFPVRWVAVQEYHRLGGFDPPAISQEKRRAANG